MKAQLDYLKESVSLAEQNPELQIHIASSNEFCAEEFSLTLHHITKVEITDYYCINEYIFTDVNDVIDYHLDYLDVEITDEDAKNKMEKVILIHTL